MKVKIFLLLALLVHQHMSMTCIAPGNLNGTGKMIVEALQKTCISDSPAHRKIPHKMTLDDLLAEPLTKKYVLAITPWDKVTSSQTAQNIFEFLANPLLQTDYRKLRTSIAAALYKGVNPNHEFMLHNFPTAVAYDDVDLVRLMLEQKVDGVNVTIRNIPPLFLASSRRMSRILQCYHARLDHRTVEGKNLLHVVLHENFDAELIYDYMQEGVNPEELDGQGLSALDYFTRFKSKYPRALANEYLVSFLNAGIPIDHPFTERHFVEAIANNDTELVTFFLGSYVDPNAEVNEQRAIFYAPTVAMAQLLRKAGVSLNICYLKGNLLHNVLIKKYDPALIPYYTSKGVSLKDTDDDGLTPLEYFCTHCYSDSEAENYLGAFLDAGIKEDTIATTLQKYFLSASHDLSDESLSTSSTDTSTTSLELTDEQQN